MNEQSIRSIIREVLAGEPPRSADAPGSLRLAQPAGNAAKPIPLEVSARHVHLTRQAVEQLFGPGATLGRTRELSQPGEFLSDRRVRLITPRSVLENVAVLGPERDSIQAELAVSDCRRLGLDAIVRLSGDQTGAADVTIAGDRGCVFAPSSVIVARAHLHLRPEDARDLGLIHGEHVGIRIESARSITLGDVVVRVSDRYASACHIDVDEANAALADSDSRAYLAGREPSAPSAAQAPKPEPDSPLLDETLVTEAMARAVRTPGGRIRIRKGTIVTPAARDVFSGMHLTIEIV